MSGYFRQEDTEKGDPSLITGQNMILIATIDCFVYSTMQRRLKLFKKHIHGQMYLTGKTLSLISAQYSVLVFKLNRIPTEQ